MSSSYITLSYHIISHVLFFYLFCWFDLHSILFYSTLLYFKLIRFTVLFSIVSHINEWFVSICPSVRPSVHPFVCLCVCLFICMNKFMFSVLSCFFILSLLFLFSFHFHFSFFTLFSWTSSSHTHTDTHTHTHGHGHTNTYEYMFLLMTRTYYFKSG